MRKLLLNLHLYAGLLCFSYLLIFGITTILFNHTPDFVRADGPTTQWQQPVSLPNLPRITPETPSDQILPLKLQTNESLRSALDLTANNLPKDSNWTNPNTYHARYVRPGKRYDVDLHLDQNLADVKETRTNVWQVLRALHGYHGTMPGSAFISSFSWYTEFCVATVLFAAASGIYLWTRRRNERRLGLLALASALAVSLALILYITLHG